ncbi:MAG: hypothetical protein GY858_08510 [Candidatus Omnitrophica bacterium]|nr:hypothetical protein [Candidatus Omnitrophota bacterium]
MSRITQSVMVDANPKDIFNQMLSWGSSEWWPSESIMRICNLDESAVEEATYSYIVTTPFGPRWKAKNEVIDESRFYLKRIFYKGAFDGFEEMHLNRGKFTQLVYSFDCRPKGFFNQMMWNIIGKKKHIENVDLILEMLKKYLEKKQASAR